MKSTALESAMDDLAKASSKPAFQGYINVLEETIEGLVTQLVASGENNDLHCLRGELKAFRKLLKTANSAKESA